MKLMRVLAGLLCLGAVGSVALANQPMPPSPLLTAPTYCDAQGVWQQLDNRVVDTRDGRLQCVADLDEGGLPGTPEDVAWAFLRNHRDWVGLDPDANLKVVRSADSPFGHHVTFERVIGGVPVYPGDLVVSMDKENVVRFYFSSLYTFSDKPAATAALSAEQAKQAAENYLNPKSASTYPPKADLVIWAGDNRDFAPCWKYRAYYQDPQGDWEVLVDANTGQIRRVEDRACYYVNGTGLVHRPDPLTSAGANYGDVGFTDNNDANSAQLQAQRFSVTLQDITDVYIFPFWFYYLNGPWVNLQDLETPIGAPVYQIASTDFSYTRDAQAYEDVMCYYHIDTSQRWIQALGFNTIQYGSIACDPHGFNGADNSHYVPGDNHLAFGEGGVDDAEDADVIWHEYGHAIQASSVPGWGGGDEGAMGEGFGDYWAASYSHALYTFHDTWVFNWDGHNPFWGGRVVNANLHYPEDNGEVHYAGQIWSQALYEAMLNVGRSTMDRIVLGHHFLLGTSASMPTAALALLTEDGTLYSGANRWAISDACVPRGLLSRPSNDVCPGPSITSLPYSTTGSTAAADNNYSNCVGTTSPDVVYNMTLASCQTVTVSLCGSGYDTAVEIRSGGSCPGSTQVACDDDGCGYPYSRTTFVAQGGLTYYIIIHGFYTYSGPYSLGVTGTAFTAPNDVCPGTSITALPYSDAGNTACATNNYDVGCVSGDPADVVYNMTLASCQTVTVSLCGSGYDTGLEVRTGGACPGSTVVGCDDDFCGYPPGHSQVTFTAIGGVTYYFIVDGYSANTGPFVLNVSGVPFVPANDACPGTTIAALPYTDTGDTRCAANNYDIGCVFGDPADVVYNMTLASCQTVTVSLCGSGYDTALEVRTDGGCPGATSVACNDDACGLQSELTFFATAGVTYFIIVDGWSANTGPFVINVTGVPYTPPNDVCPGTTIASLPYTDSGDTRCAANDYDAVCVYGDPADVVYNLTLGTCQTVTVTLCGSGYDTGLAVRTGGACPGTTEVTCDDDNYCGPNYVLQSTVTFTAQAGTAYYIIVDGFFTATGPFVMNVTGAPCSVPAAPDSLVAQLSGVNINLYWSSVTGAVSYKVYRKVTPDVAPIPADFLADAPTNTYVDAGAINSAPKYFYLVTAMSAAGDLLAELPPQGERADYEAYVQSKLEQARTGQNEAAVVYPAVMPGFAAQYAEVLRQSEAKSQTEAVSPAELGFVPYGNPEAASAQTPDKALETAKFQKTEMPADETLRVNLYVPAYAQFTSPNVTK